jgi:tetratricopeptide (TPR) repeat protein
LSSHKLTIEQALSKAKKASKQGRIDIAIQLYKAVLQSRPSHSIASKQLHQLQKIKYKQHVQMPITHPPQDTINTLTNLYRSGKLEKTEKACENILKIHPQAFLVLNILGLSLRRQNKLQEALQIFSQAIKLKPDYLEAHGNLGNILTTLNQPRKAIESYNKVIQLSPNHNNAYNSLCVAYRDLGKLGDALKSCNKAIQIKPDYAEAYGSRGNVFKDLGEIDNAVKDFNKAIQLNPNDIKAHFNLALSLLLQGDFKNGWDEYEWRCKKDSYVAKINRLSIPIWNGSSLNGKTILVTSEQGIGDEVMFSSCIPDLIKKNPKQIIVECDSRLSTLLEYSFPQIFIINTNNGNFKQLKNNNKIDFQISLGSLPKFFRQDVDDFNCNKSFISPDKKLVEKWRKRYDSLDNKIKVGISWRGGKKKRLKSLRSIDLDLWETILQSKVSFITLQYGDHSQEIKKLELKTGVKIHNWIDANPLTDLNNFAAQISALDLVISVDNSTVHFAGSLGTPTWVLLPFAPDFRWMLNCNNSPWYPAIKLFRQSNFGDWSQVLSSVKNELQALIKKQP